jgi:hypothetical protein
MKQKSRIFFVTSWLVVSLRWSLALVRASVSNGALQRLGSQPGIVLFSRHHYRFPIDRWIFDQRRSAYLYSVEPEEPFRIHFLPGASRN